jgi:hypothetical protein
MVLSRKNNGEKVTLAKSKRAEIAKLKVITFYKLWLWRTVNRVLCPPALSLDRYGQFLSGT